MVTRVDSTADDAWRDVLDAVRAAGRAAGEQDVLDEAAQLRLKHHGLAGGTLWLAGADGFALAHDGAVDLAVAPEARGRGLGGELAAAALAGDAPVTAWSHDDHPAAAVLAARHGLRRARELWVMRRRSSEPLPGLVVPDGVTVRGYRDEDRDEVLRVNAAAFAHHPEQGSLDARGPGGADGRGVVRPGRAARRRRGRRSCAGSTGPSSTAPSSARCTSWRSTRPRRGRDWAGC